MESKILLAVSFVIIVFALYLLNKVNNTRAEEISEKVKTNAQLMLIEKKIVALEEKMELMVDSLNSIEIKNSGKQLDGLAGYSQDGFSVQEMAKKMNKSVKEVELLMKMRGRQDG